MDFPGDAVVQTPCFPLQGAWVQSLKLSGRNRAVAGGGGRGGTFGEIGEMSDSRAGKVEYEPGMYFEPESKEDQKG